MGFTNFKDKVDPGETVVIPPATPQTAEKDAIVQQVSEYAQSQQHLLTPAQREMAAGFWGSSASAQMPRLNAADLIQSARGAAQMARAEGADPMALLHQAGREGKLPVKVNVVARAKM